MWQQWVNAILGLWIIAIPFIGITSGDAMTWTLAISGLAVAVLSAWGAMQHQQMYEDRYERRAS